MYGTLIQRDFPAILETDEGYWWRKNMTEAGFVAPIQAGKRYDRIPANPDSPNTLFISPQPGLHVPVVGGSRVPINEYLGNLLKEYMLLLIEALRLHNNKIENSTLPLLTPT